MNLPKAIEILTTLTEPESLLDTEELHDAIKLGIEALKEVKKARYGDPALDGELLPGETEEELKER